MQPHILPHSVGSALCGTDNEALSRFLDNDLPSREAAALLVHLQTCPSCRAAYGDLQKAQSALRHLPLPTAPFGGPDAARVRVMERVDRSVRVKMPAAKRPFVPLWAGAMAAACVLGAAFVRFGLTADEPMDAAAPLPAVVRVVPAPSATPRVPLPSENEMAFLYHLHDARSASISAADPTDRRDCAAEARAALLRDTERIADNGAL